MSDERRYRIPVVARAEHHLWTEGAAQSAIGKEAPVTDGVNGSTICMGKIVGAEVIEDGQALRLTLEISEPIPGIDQP